MVNSPDKFLTFLGRYRYKGKTCAFDLLAEDFNDAEARLAAICLSGKTDGQLMAAVHCPPPETWVVRVIVFLRRWF